MAEVNLNKLVDIFVMEDGHEQKHFELIFNFEVGEYGLKFDSGLSLQDFRMMMRTFSDVIQRVDPEEV